MADTESPGGSPSLVNLAYEYLREQIVKRRLPPGTRLVNRVLAREIGVSFTPVREAINRLASEGIVRQVAGAGAFVEHIRRSDIVDLYSVRRSLESLVMQQATERIGQLHLSVLEQLCDNMQLLAESAQQSSKPFLEGESLARWQMDVARFEETILAAAGNRWLLKMVGDLRTVCHAFATAPLRISSEQVSHETLSYRALWQSLAAHQSGAAVSWAEKSTDQSLAAALRGIDDNAPGSRPSA